MTTTVPTSNATGRRSYATITGSYWSFTITDGALRMLVLLHFYNLGYTPLQIASLFLFYEFFGVVTNLVGGWIASHFGLKSTLTSGLLLQILALVMLGLLDPYWPVAISVAYVMTAQALSGIAKDLVKMSSKSSVKLLVQEGQQGALFKWVAVLTGSKNALKGLGFFVGGALLSRIGFDYSLYTMAAALVVTWLLAILYIAGSTGKVEGKVRFAHLLSKSSAINRLSAARFFLFGSRDVWFVVGLPIYLTAELQWPYARVGAFLAAWVIGYGIVQMLVPILVGKVRQHQSGNAATAALVLAIGLAVMVFAIWQQWPALLTIIVGLSIYGFLFAVNSGIHSYLVLAYGQREQIAMDVGFYYMANAGGRLVGTVLSGYFYQTGGLLACMAASLVFVILSWLLALRLPPITTTA
ncbi:MAG: organoarsenical effux MFS transporter ArsJ [Acidiferrobacterales bacterium]